MKSFIWYYDSFLYYAVEAVDYVMDLIWIARNAVVHHRYRVCAKYGIELEDDNG